MNAPPQFPLACHPGGPVPLRRPGSIRRTTSIDTGWPQGLGQPMLMLGQARDIWTGPEGGAPTLLAQASFRILATAQREIVEIATDPPHPRMQDMVGVRAGGQSRIALADVLGDLKGSGVPLYQLLDDFAGASLVAGWIWSQWEEGWLNRVRSQSPAEFRARMTDICTGFAAGSSALAMSEDGGRAQSHAEVESLVHPQDPEGWHRLDDHPGVSKRRARWIDLWREGDGIRVEAGFQDSGTNPKGGRTAIHEYRLIAHMDAVSHVLTDLDVTPHVLPFPECPGAAGKAKAMAGQNLESFRQAVLDTLPSTLGCTHLNDVLRGLADVPALARLLR